MKLQVLIKIMKKNSVKLGVNIDHIATLRQARLEGFPSPLLAALECEKAGANGITVHLREDRRHIQDADVFELRKKIKTKLNLEMAVCEEIIKIALKVKPDFVCLVPEKRRELTTEGGLDVIAGKNKISKAVKTLKKAGIKVSLFIDPTINQVNASLQVGADCIELHTGKYAKCFAKNSQKNKELNRIKQAAKFALKAGMLVNAGHGLDYKNVKSIASINGINELNIGFSIIARAVFVGLPKAVKEMKKLI